MLFTPSNTMNILPLLKKMPYDAEKGFDPVGRAGDMVCGFVAHSVGRHQVVSRNCSTTPGRTRASSPTASSGSGTATQMRIEMLKLKAGVDILHVPYRGGADALNDLLANTVQLMNEASTLPHVKSGKLHPPQHQSPRAQQRLP